MDKLTRLATEVALQAPLPPEPPDLVVSCSGGNDSAAVLCWTIEHGRIDMRGMALVYLDTGWATEGWHERRIEPLFELAARHGAQGYVVPSMGFAPLAMAKRMVPRNQLQFCTQFLKRVPFTAWLEAADPEKEATVMLGVRRQESRARAQWPTWARGSEAHGGRDVWSPLTTMDTGTRDALLLRHGVPVLPFRSAECSPCVNSNKAQLRLLPEADVTKVAALEDALNAAYGPLESGPRTFFRRYRHQGAVGIQEVLAWAGRGEGDYGSLELFEGGCDSGLCGV